MTLATDDPDSRFAPGSVLIAEPGAAGPLTVAAARRSGPVMVVAFDGITDRNAAETLRGTLLSVDSDELPPPMDDDEYYDHQLIGLAVRRRDGTVLGEVTGVMHPPAAPVLQVARPGGGEELVPFVRVIVPEVDLEAGLLVVDPPDGMFGQEG